MLIDTRTLEQELNDPRLRLIETTMHLDRTDSRYSVRSGCLDYEAAHIPGTVYRDIEVDLSDATGRLAFARPPATQLERYGLQDSPN